MLSELIAPLLALPTSAWLALSFPQILSGGVHVPVATDWTSSFGASVFYLPLGQSRSLSSLGLNLGVEWQSPLSFISVGQTLSWQRNSVSIPLNSLKTDGYPAPAGTLNLSGLYYTPSIEFKWLTRQNFDLSSAIGGRICLLGLGSIHAESQDPAQKELAAQVEVSSRKVGAFFSNLLVPQLTFLQVNWRL